MLIIVPWWFLHRFRDPLLVIALLMYLTTLPATQNRHSWYCLPVGATDDDSGSIRLNVTVDYGPMNVAAMINCTSYRQLINYFFPFSASFPFDMFPVFPIFLILQNISSSLINCACFNELQLVLKSKLIQVQSNLLNGISVKGISCLKE